jgi:hypothetical protein
MRVPTIVAGAVMPDACPAGAAPGTIPVGGVIAAKDAIHPGMHSADICCSMAATVFGDAKPSDLLDAGMTLSHFGGGGRPRGAQVDPPDDVMAAFAANDFLRPHTSAAIEHFATQGDGNHFFYVGRLASTGELTLVTHHGSRKPGALLYKSGMEVAERFRRDISPETPRHNAWIPADTKEAVTIGARCSRSAPGPRRTTSRSMTGSPRRSACASHTGSGTSTISCSARATACSTTRRAQRRPGAGSPTTTAG